MIDALLQLLPPGAASTAAQAFQSNAMQQLPPSPAADTTVRNSASNINSSSTSGALPTAEPADCSAAEATGRWADSATSAPAADPADQNEAASTALQRFFVGDWEMTHIQKDVRQDSQPTPQPEVVAVSRGPDGLLSTITKTQKTKRGTRASQARRLVRLQAGGVPVLYGPGRCPIYMMNGQVYCGPKTILRVELCTSDRVFWQEPLQAGRLMCWRRLPTAEQEEPAAASPSTTQAALPARAILHAGAGRQPTEPDASSGPAKMLKQG